MLLLNPMTSENPPYLLKVLGMGENERAEAPLHRLGVWGGLEMCTKDRIRSAKSLRPESQDGQKAGEPRRTTCALLRCRGLSET